MPPVTVTLTETEACHVRELIQEDRETSITAIRLFPEDRDFHEALLELDEGLLEKLKDA
jgi:hypothetical protein